MIRANAALTRQAQEFFRQYLVGIYRWDDVEFAPKEKQKRPAVEITSRGRRRRPESPEGKYRAIVQMDFGIWRLTIEGPTEHPPLGWLKLEGHDELEGPLDPMTWKRFGEHIQQKTEELKNVA